MINTSQLTLIDVPPAAPASTGPVHCAQPGRTSRNPYGHVLRGAIAEAVDQATLRAPTEQVMLYAELELTKQAAAASVARWQAECDLPDETAGKLERMMHAGCMMQSQLAVVAEMAKHVTAIEAVSSEKFSVHNLHLIVEQLVGIAHTVFDKLPADLAGQLKLEFSQLVQSHVKIENENRKLGTDLKPDQIVLDMDDTIPSGPSE